MVSKGPSVYQGHPLQSPIISPPGGLQDQQEDVQVEKSQEQDLVVHGQKDDKGQGPTARHPIRPVATQGNGQHQGGETQTAEHVCHSQVVEPGGADFMEGH